MEWESEDATVESIEILVDIEKNRWFREEDVGTFIGMFSIVDQTRGLSYRNRRPRADLVPAPSYSTWPETTRDIFLSVNGLLSVTTHSRKPKARNIMAWLVQDVLPKMHEDRREKAPSQDRQARGQASGKRSQDGLPAEATSGTK